MIYARQPESPFAVPSVLATHGVPEYFNPPRLQLVAESGEVAYWRDTSGASELLKVKQAGSRLRIVGIPSNEIIETNSIKHPLTGEQVDLNDPIARLELTPTPRLIRVLLDVVKSVSGQIDSLDRVVSLPFFLSSNTIRVDIDRALGQADPLAVSGVLEPEDIVELRPAMKAKFPSTSDEATLRKELLALGEKCLNMSEYNCSSCVNQKKYLCLRSLVGYNRKSCTEV